MHAAAGGVPHRLRHLAVPSVDRDLCAQFAGQRKLVLRDIDGHHPRTHGPRDHDRRQADAAAPMHGDPFAAPQTPLINNSPKGRGKPTAKAGGGVKAHAVRQGNQIQIGLRQGDIFRKTAPMGKAGLELRIADLLVSGMAFGATAAGTDKRNGDPVPQFPATDPSPECGNRARQFVARHMRQFDVRVMPHPAVPIAPA